MSSLLSTSRLAGLLLAGLLMSCSLGTPAKVACPRDVCSDHGDCTEVNEVNARPICSCDDGYTGVVCATCASGYHRSDADLCVADQSCGGDMGNCGPHGTCELTVGTVACACDPGYAGVQCGDCYAGYHLSGDGGLSCVVDQMCLPSSCSGAGSCDDSGGSAVCSCNAGYTGAVCDGCSAGFYRDTQNHCLANVLCATANPCSTHSSCDDSSGTPLCACDPGYAGVTCSDCYPGYHDSSGSCVLDDQCLASSCSGASAGVCLIMSGVISCTCFPGYVGSDCESCDSAYHRDALLNCVANQTCALANTCSSHSTCVDATGVVKCVCDDGYAGETCADCYPGYHPSPSPTPSPTPAPDCVLDEVCRATSCGGDSGATCDDTGGVVTCSCSPNFEGDHCEFNVDGCVNTDCHEEVCGNSCVDLPTATDHVCLCFDGTYGLTCPSPNPNPCPS